MSGVRSGNARILSQELRKPDLQVDQGGADANAIADHGGQPTAARRTFSPEHAEIYARRVAHHLGSDADATGSVFAIFGDAP
jgi:hypothetical protein